MSGKKSAFLFLALVWAYGGLCIGLTTNGQPTNDSLKRIGFIHITKTGGTAIEKSIYAKYLNSFGHKKTISNFSQAGDIAVSVVRDPVSRFLSIYNYWRHGSDMYNREIYWKPPVNSINDFMDAWRDDKHPKHLEVLTTVSKGRGFTWAAHFLPQSHWLIPASSHSTVAKMPVTISEKLIRWFHNSHYNEYFSAMKMQHPNVDARKNVIIIRHSKDRKKFTDRVTAAFTFALAALNITKSESTLLRERNGQGIPVINVSKRPKHGKVLSDVLSVKNLKWLNQKFQQDFQLVEKVNVQYYTGKGPWKAVF